MTTTIKISKKLLIVSLFVFIIFNCGFIFSNEQNTKEANLVIDQLTSVDRSDNYFYLSKNSIKEINFNVFFNSNTDDLSEKKIIYSSEILSNNFNSNQVKFDLSKSEEYFFKNLNSNLQLTIITKDIIDSSFILKIEAKVYDNYNNLITTQRKYLYFISNNLDGDIADSQYGFNGFNYSRSVALIKNKNDFDVIRIKTNSFQNTGYDISCKANNSLINTEIIYIQKTNEFDLNISIKDGLDSFLVADKYLISCHAFNAYENIKLKDIILVYENKDILFSEINPTEKKQNTINITALIPLSENKNKNLLTGLFIFVLILFILSLSVKK